MQRIKGLVFFFCIVVFGLPASASERWKVSVVEDEMTGKKTYFSSSPWATSTKPLAFPNAGVKSFMAVVCDEKDYSVSFGFSAAPNLLGTNTEDGYNTLITRLKIDDKITNVRLRQFWGTEMLEVDIPKPSWTVGGQPGGRKSPELIRLVELINSLPKANKLLLELNWYGNGSVYFPYSMAGSAKALAQLRSQCK